jgi:hypothetical protein
VFNAFKYTKQLEEAGFSREQAELQLQVITEIVEGDLATKQDLAILKTDLLNAIDAKANLFEIKTNNLENKIQQLEYRITIKLGSLLIIGFTTMATLIKIWLSH